MDIQYHQNTSGGWKVGATMDGVPLEFSGSFNPARISAEKANMAFAKVTRNVAWVLVCIGALGFLYAGYSLYYFDGIILFPFEKHVGNLFGFVGVLAGLYLWAVVLHEEAERSESRVLSAAKILEWQNKKTTVDVFDLFTDEARRVWDLGLSLGQGKTSAAHILSALLQDKSVQLAFLRFGVRPDQVQKIITSIDPALLQNDAEVIFKLPFAALDEALRLKNRSVDSLMLLTALIRELPDSHPVAKMFFALDFGQEQLEIIAAWIFNLNILIEDDRLISRIAKHRSDKGINRALTAVPTPYLNQFSRDLTLDAKYHHLPLTRGREKDTEEVVKLLSQGRSVLVLGGKGTGRRTVLADLAYRMAGENVPMHLQDKRLVELELAGILGSQVPPEQVIVNLFNEAEHSGNLIFALPDAHELAKATGSEGLPILEIFLSHLANSSVQLIATATPESFQTSMRSIPRVGELLATHELIGLDHFGIVIACGIRASGLEAQYGVFFRYQAIEEAVKLTNSLATQDAGQPEKAIEILQTAAQSVKGLSGEGKIITAQTIQRIVSEFTHVPLEALTAGESDKLLHMEDDLSKYITGQKEAVVAVSESLRRARSGLTSDARPLASFLFVGPTGVGKTELAKTLAKVYFGKSEYMLRLDMSEYQGGDGMRKLLGGGGESSETPFVVHLKTYPFCLFLLDELEKASGDVLNLFLQVLEDGRITTASGQTLDLTHTIIIATSNAGTKEIQEGIKQGEKLVDIKTRLLETILIQHYRPEFLNRFDGIILFSPLAHEEVEQITRLQLKLVSDKLLEQKIRLAFSDAVVNKIATEAFDPLLGARPVRRYIQDRVESVIAKLLLSKQLGRGGEGVVDVSEDGEFIVK